VQDTFAARAARLEFSRDPAGELGRWLAQIRLLLIDDFALQPMDATETADAPELTHQDRPPTSRSLSQTNGPGVRH